MTPIAQAAADLRPRGLALCRVDHNSKRAYVEGWTQRSAEPDEFTIPDLLGVQGGPLSHGNRPGHALVIIDLDSDEAVRQADGYLPATPMADGRRSKPRSHRFFLVPLDSIPVWGRSAAAQAAPAAVAATGCPGPFTKSFRDRQTFREIIKFIGTGGMAVVPPSIHPSGEARAWDAGRPGDPSVVTFLDLWDAVGQLASRCGAAVPRVVSDVPRTSTIYLRRPWEAKPITRAVRYLQILPGAISGQGGHRAAFWASRVLVTGFRLPINDALRLLLEVWNPKCQPAWSERELLHKVEDAKNLPFGKPDGWLLAPDRREPGKGRQ
jgi:hypothetical protein